MSRARKNWNSLGVTLRSWRRVFTSMPYSHTCCHTSETVRERARSSCTSSANPATLGGRFTREQRPTTPFRSGHAQSHAPVIAKAVVPQPTLEPRRGEPLQN